MKLTSRHARSCGRTQSGVIQCMAQTRASKMTSKFLLLSNLHSLLSPDLNVKCNALFVLQKDVEMVMKNNAFVRLPVSDRSCQDAMGYLCRRTPDAVWRKFDTSFKGILTSGGDKTYSHRTGRQVTHFKSARAGDKHDRSSLLPQFKKGETEFQ